MTADNYMREMIYGLLREEEKKKAPPRVFAPPKASDLVASARKIMAQHQCAIDPTWIKCRSWSNLEAAWLALGIDPNLTDPWRLDRDWRPGLTPIAEDLARRLSRLVGEAGAPTDFIQVMTDLGIRPDWMDAEPIVTGEQDEASKAGRGLANARHRVTNEEKARITSEADPLIQRGTLNHVQIAKEIGRRGSWLLTPHQIKNAVKERCTALGRTDLILGHPDYLPITIRKP